MSPHPTPDALNPLDHVPQDAYPRPQPGPGTHDHGRTMSTGGARPMPGAHTHSHAGQPGQAAHHMHPGQPGQAAGGQSQPGPSGAPAPPIALRAPYHAAMQMHHVPHPHAHARHHASSVNRMERIYGAADHNIVNISAEGIKGDMQRRGSDMMRFGNASNSK